MMMMMMKKMKKKITIIPSYIILIWYSISKTCLKKIQCPESMKEESTDAASTASRSTVRKFHIWVFPKIGGTPKWMMKIMEDPII